MGRGKNFEFPTFYLSKSKQTNLHFLSAVALEAESPSRLSASSADGPALAKLGLAFTVLLAFGNEFSRGRGVQQFHVNLFKSTV